ncbi:hypothetical protein SNEBB_003287 [Seison nebaliae]|nr:hypothetical protein SNEBB_003287 [Seison nebaliae]
MATVLLQPSHGEAVEMDRTLIMEASPHLKPIVAKASAGSKVEVLGASHEGLLMVRNYIYNGRTPFNFDVRKAHTTLLTAERLEMEDLQFKCIEYLNKNDTSDLFTLNNITQFGTMNEYTQILHRTPVKEWDSSLEFYELSYDQVVALLGQDAMVMNEEYEVFFAALSWIAYDLDEREWQTPGIMNMIRFHTMEEPRLRYLFRFTPFDLTKFRSIRQQAYEALWFIVHGNSGQDPVLRLPAVEPRMKFTKADLLTMSSESSGTYNYNNSLPTSDGDGYGTNSGTGYDDAYDDGEEY